MKTFILFHVGLSLAGILSGFIVLGSMLASRRPGTWTTIFLATTAATSITGFFFFPFFGFTPGQVFGILSVILLAFAIYGLAFRGLAGGWRRTYVITSVAALYLNFFVLIVQSFEKVPALHALAPKQTEPPVAITQGVVLVVFIVLGTFAAIRFRPAPAL